MGLLNDFSFAVPEPSSLEDDYREFHARAVRDGKNAKALAREVLEERGFEVVQEKKTLKGVGIVIDFEVKDQEGGHWYVDVTGAFTTTRPGLQRTDSILKALGRAHIWRQARRSTDPVLLLLTTHLPEKGPARKQLKSVGPNGFFDAISMFSGPDQERLASYARNGWEAGPEPGFWRGPEIEGWKRG